MDSTDADQRLSHQLDPPEFVSLKTLEKLGVLYWNFDSSNYDSNPEFKKLKEERGYTYEDKIEVSSTTLDNYETKIKSFYDEHIHTDEEIRYVLDGSGYFDVRDFNDKWIRIEVVKGDMIVLPAGIYHRFTLDTNNYIKALRLFVGEPIWTPYSRSTLDESHPSIKSYRDTFSRAAGQKEGQRQYQSILGGD